MKPRMLLPAIAILLLSGCASKATKPTESDELTPFSAQGWGGTNCKELIHDITPKNVGFQQAIQNIHLYQSWASGFVSGVNYESDVAYDVSGGSTPEEIFAWLKNYCSEHEKTAIPLALHELLDVWKEQDKVQTEAE